MKIICLGKTGTGKSSLANTLIGRNMFKADQSAEAVTIQCAKGESMYEGIEIVVVDTPGLFDCDRSSEDVQAAITACTQAVLPGPHAFLLVLRCDQRFTREDQETVKWMRNKFGKDRSGKDALEYSVVVFTHADQLQQRSLDEWLPQSKDSPIRRLISACGNRIYGINNTATEQTIRARYVTDLVNIIDQLIQRNRGHEYVPPLMSDIAQIIQKRYKESSGQHKFIDPNNGVIRPDPEAIRAVQEFYRRQQQRQQEDRHDE